VEQVSTNGIGDSRTGLDNDNLIDIRAIRNYLSFTLNSVRRHWIIGLTMFVATVGLTIAGLLVWPKTYRVEAKIVARRNDLMTSLSNPTRANRPEADDPTRAASEMMHHRENLLSVMQQTNLLAEWQRTRSRLARWKDGITGLLHRVSDEERLDGLLSTLEQKLTVSVDKENVVTIGLEWRDNAKLATDIVQAAMQNFIDMRHEQETSAITEAISILEGSAASLQHDVDGTIAKLREEQASHPAVTRLVPPRRPATATRVATVTANAQPAPETRIPGPDPAMLASLSRLNAALEAKRQEIKRVESQRAQQLADVKGRLSAALAIYTQDHPTVSSLQQTVETASQDPAELLQLREEERQLRSQFDVIEQSIQIASAQPVGAGVGAGLPEPKPAADPAPQAAAPMLVLPTDVQRLTDMVNPTSRLLTLQLAQLANLLDRINGARLELATAGAGIKFRYNVTRPPQMPKSPIKPKMIPVVLAGMMGAMMLAFAICIAIDLGSDLVLEPWQLERLINRPVVIVPASLVE
jgi:uncharacterized protein involved in exopolysaccharide biosynthesis